MLFFGVLALAFATLPPAVDGAALTEFVLESRFVSVALAAVLRPYIRAIPEPRGRSGLVAIMARMVYLHPRTAVCRLPFLPFLFRIGYVARRHGV